MDDTQDGNQGQTVSWRVQGMDCASCAAKVGGALKRLPGVSNVAVNLMAERLTLRLEQGRTDRAAVERTISAIGYTPHLLPAIAAGAVLPHLVNDDADHDHAGHDHDNGDHGGAFGHSHADHEDLADATRPWYAPGKARLVWLLGVLVLGAYALSLALPDRLTYPLILAATLVALVPFGRRAFALARAGSPFSIETRWCRLPRAPPSLARPRRPPLSSCSSPSAS